MGLGGAAQVGDRFDAEFLPQLACPLGAESRQLHQLHQRARDLFGQVLEYRQTAFDDQLADVPRHVLPDRGKGGEVLPGRNHRPHRGGMILHGARGVAVGAHPERIGARDLQQVCHFFEASGDLDVFHQAVIPWRASRARNVSSSSTGTLSFSARARFDPASSPATT